MANAGNTFTIQLKKAHLEWGNYRHTNSRDIIYGEGYVPIPAKIARNFMLYNKIGTNGCDVLGKNIFKCSSVDGFLTDCILKSSGNSKAGEIYAKQFHGSGDLQILGDWFRYVGAQEGDYVEITWTSPTDIVIKHY